MTTKRGSTWFVYLAGPYRGTRGVHDYSAYFDIDANIRSAHYWSMECAKQGIPYFCPHLNSAHGEVIAPEVPSDFWLEMDLNILRNASAILMLPNWKSSRGAVAERQEAEYLGLPVYSADRIQLPMLRSLFLIKTKEEAVAVH